MWGSNMCPTHLQSLFVSFITDESLCERQPCDEKTTECNPLDGTFSCTCQESYILTNFSHRMCTGKLSERASVRVCLCMCVYCMITSLSKLKTTLTFAFPTFAACPSGQRAESKMNKCVK